MENKVNYAQFRAYASCQDWLLLRETSVKIEGNMLLVGWFITPRGAILQVETIAGAVECVSVVPLMAPEGMLETKKPPRPKKRPRDGDDEPEPCP